MFQRDNDVFNFQNKKFSFKIYGNVYMTTFEDKVDDLTKETKKGLKNSKTINDVADEVVKNFNYFQLKIQSLDEKLSKLEWKPKTTTP